VYSPKITKALIPALYRLAWLRRTPMTRLVSEALAEYLAQQPDAREFLPRAAPTPRRSGGAPRPSARGNAVHRALDRA
jgi:hypothetical protein